MSFGLVSYSEILVSARARVKMALSGRGMDECVDVPRAVRSDETRRLVGGRDADVLNLAGLVLDDPAAFVQGKFAIDLVPGFLGEIARAVAGRLLRRPPRAKMMSRASGRFCFAIS